MLTDEQKTFLMAHQIPLSKVFDATGMSTKEYQRAMKGTNMLVAFGAIPCAKEGHTLRTKSGHCLPCKPERIAYQKRSVSKGHVYIAGSMKGRYIKIGLSKNLDDRLYKLNEYAYGGAQDWIMLASAHVENSGRVETKVQTELEEFRVEGTYQRAGKEQKCKELFRCNFEQACRLLHQASGGLLTLRSSSIEQTIKNYSFK